MVAVVVVVAVAADQKQKLIEFMQPAKPRRDRTTMLTVQTCAEWDTDATLRADIVTEAVHHMTTVREMDEANIAALWRRILAPCFRHNARERHEAVCMRTDTMRNAQFRDDLRAWVQCMPKAHRREFLAWYRRRHGALLTKVWFFFHARHFERARVGRGGLACARAAASTSPPFTGLLRRPMIHRSVCMCVHFYVCVCVCLLRLDSARRRSTPCSTPSRLPNARTS
jgi:hypothetical protein